MVWLDGLDIPLVRFLDCGFAENNPRGNASRCRGPRATWLARYGDNLLPVELRADAFGLAGVRLSLRRARREALEQLGPRGRSAIRAHGYKMQFINPATGGPAMPTMAAFIQCCRRASPAEAIAATDGTVFHVIEGRGECVIGDQRIAFGPRDTFVVPSWVSHRLQAQRKMRCCSASRTARCNGRCRYGANNDSIERRAAAHAVVRPGSPRADCRSRTPT